MTFQAVEQRFRELEKLWAAGRLSKEDYRKALESMWITDPDGNTWGIQMHTGRWFVLRDGLWQTETPPRAKLQQPAAPIQASVSAPAQAHARHAPTNPPKRRQNRTGLLLGAVALILTCIVCGLVGGVGYLVTNGTIPIPGLVQENPRTAPQTGEEETSAPVEITISKTLDTIAVAPDGIPHADSHGVALVVPAEVGEVSQQVTLSALELDAPWRKELEKVVSIDTPFYQLSAAGKSDTPGSLAMSFPAANPNARLMAVIDNEYLVELAQTPEDGKLVLETRAGPEDISELKPPEGYDGSGSIYYVVVTPKTNASDMGSNRTAALYLAQSDERNCIPDLSILGGAAINLCRQNEAGTINVMLPTLLRELRPQVDQMVDKIEAAMNSYAGHGFTTAALSKRSPMLVRVSAKVKNPTYYPANGVLYIPKDTVANIAAKSPTDVYHEMAHWIQAVKYSTLAAYWSEEKTWWLETAAENMVMLIEPGYLGGNLLEYGTITTSAETLAFQNGPYQWPNDFYIHAQLLKINICDSSACPLSPASFAKAISDGRYPIDGAAKSMISDNLKDYAYYLLGKSPTRANTSISLSGAVHTGEGYGEFVQVTSGANTDHKYTFNGRAPQMAMGTRDGKEALEISARLQRDGVYPLMVLGGEGKFPGLPVELVVEPGAPFYYTLDDGAFIYSDGSKELTVRPIHGKMGIRKVRVVAVGEHGGEVFKAHVQTLNLEGAWAVMITGAKTAGTTVCSDDSVKTEQDGTARLMAYVLAMASGSGDMKMDASGRSLDWSEVAGRAPAEFIEEGVTFKGTALLTGDGIKYQAVVDVPKHGGESNLPGGLPAALAALPLIWLARKWLGEQTLRVLVNLLVIGGLALVSAGCFGMGMYGSTSLDALFDKIEYVGGEETGSLVLGSGMSLPTGKPIWKLTGTGTYDPVFFIEATTVDQNGKEDTKVTTCSGKVTFQVTAYIYKDMTLSIASDSDD